MKIGQSLQFLDNMYLNGSTPRNIENFSSYNVTDSGSLMLNTFPLPPIGLHYWQVVFLSTAITLGVPGNLLVIVSYSMNRRKTDCDWYIVYIAVLDLIVCLFRVPTYLSMETGKTVSDRIVKTGCDWYIVYIAVLDVIVCLFRVPTNFLFIETGFWQSHATDALCKAVYWISQSVITASVILFGFIAIDRFIRVCCTTLKVSPRASMTFVGAMSVGSAISAAPTFLMYAQGSRGCVPVATLLGFTMMRIYYTVLFAIFIVMFIIVVITYTLIVIKVRHARKVLNGPTGRKSTENDQAAFSHRLHTVFMTDSQRKLGPKSATFQTEDDPLDDESSLSRTTTLEKNPTMQPTSTHHPWMTVNNGGKQIWQSFRLVDREDANRNALTVPTNEEWHVHVSGDRFEPRIRCMDRATDPHSRGSVFNVPMDTVNYVRSPGISEKSCKKDFNTPLKLDEVENEVKLPCSLKYNSFVAGRLHDLSEGMPGQRRSRSFVKTLTHFERHNARIKRNARDIQMTMLLLVITVIFVVSWIPPYLAMAWFFYVGYTPPPPYTVAEVSLMTYAPTGYILNHFASPFVYIALSPTFKKNIINLFLSVPRILQRGT